MAEQYQSKLCPKLKFNHCREHECQLWWRCREPQTEAVQLWECADLEAMAERLVGDLMVVLGFNPLPSMRSRMEPLALKTLEEVARREFTRGIIFEARRDNDATGGGSLTAAQVAQCEKEARDG